MTGVAEDYKDMSGILSTYADHTVITHNEVSNLAYDGIDVGWGWGTNDPGGSQDYVNRGLYAYQPIYTTPTTLKDTVVEDNLIHGTKKVFHDGGSIYNLSANPGARISGNYIYDNQHTVGLYMDEGSRYVTEHGATSCRTPASGPSPTPARRTTPTTTCSRATGTTPARRKSPPARRTTTS